MFMLEEASRFLTGKVNGTENAEMDGNGMGDLDENDDEKLTFHQAARYGNCDVVKQYLDKFRRESEKKEKENKENLVNKLTNVNVKNVVNKVNVKQYLDKYRETDEPVIEEKEIDKLDDHDWSALHYAVRYGHMEVIQILIANDANVSIEAGNDGIQPLHVAAKYYKARKQSHSKLDTQSSKPLTENGNMPITDENAGPKSADKPPKEEDEVLEVITYLLMNGADINCTDNYTRTPLHYAATKGNIGAITLLINGPGVDLEVEDTAGQTPLFSTCVGNAQPETFKLLLLAGSKLMVSDRDMQSPLHYAAEAGGGELILREVIELTNEAGRVLEKYNLSDLLNARDDRKRNVLHRAIEAQNLEMCTLALQHGADINSLRIDLNSPLHVASLTGCKEIVELLIESGTNLEALNKEKQTPLHLAAERHNVSIIEYLLGKGCNVNAVDRKNKTPIVMAASEKGENVAEAIKILLDHGADLTETDIDEKSAVFHAAEQDSFNALKLLLEKSRSSRNLRSLIDQTDRLDNTPLHIACTKGYQNIVKLLIAYHARVDYSNDEELTPLHLASIHGHDAAVLSLLTKQKMLVNKGDESGNTPLHLAASNGHTKVIEIFIDNGASIDAQNIDMSTALHTAAKKGQVECCVQLIEKAANMNSMDLTKSTPLHVASKEGYEEVVKTLLSKGADVSMIDSKGRNALNIAIYECHKNVVEVILQHDDWLVAAKNSFKEGKVVTTAIHQLIRKLPDVAYTLLNRCTKLSAGLPFDAEDYEVEFFYELIDNPSFNSTCETMTSDNSHESKILPAVANDKTPLIPKVAIKKSTPKEAHPLKIMCDNNLENLLQHPLCLSLIYHKWQKFGRYVFYSKLLLYLLFLVLYTAYVIVTVPVLPKPKVAGNGTYVCVPLTPEQMKAKHNSLAFSAICGVLLISVTIIQLILEILQLYNKKLAYFDVGNLLEWVIYATALLFASPRYFLKLFATVPQGPVDNFMCTSFLSIAAAGIFLAWVNLLLFLQKFPTIGIYVLMLFDVTKTFLKFSVTFLLFLLSFAVAFFTLQYNEAPKVHANIGKSLAKTMAMMMGDFDFDGMFNGDTQQPLMMWVLFFLFIVVMVILLTNLMVGLAVGDIQVVLDKAVVARISMQVDLVLDVEKSLPKGLRKKLLTGTKCVYPNREYKWYNKMLMSHITRMNEIEEAIKADNQDDAENDHLHQSVDSLQLHIRDLRRQVKQVEGMVHTLLKASSAKN